MVNSSPRRIYTLPAVLQEGNGKSLRTSANRINRKISKPVEVSFLGQTYPYRPKNAPHTLWGNSAFSKPLKFD